MRMAGTYAMHVFGKPERSINCDCERANEPTLLQAVFLQNDPLVRMRLADSGWIAEVSDLDLSDRSGVIEEVWLRTVGRPPTDEEVTRAGEHLENATSLAEGTRELLWAMLNTKEFLLNH